MQHRATSCIGVWLITLLPLALAEARADDWPQWGGPQRDGVWRETGIVERFAARELSPLWQRPIGPGYAGPAVADGRVFVTDRLREQKSERVWCLDAKTGDTVWMHEYPCVYRGVDYDSGPRATPTVHAGKVYTVGTMGHLFCLDAKTGAPVWQKDYVKDFDAKLPTWGAASAPLIDGPRLIAVVGGPGSAVVAFDKNTGRELWRNLSVRDTGYAPPVMIRSGGTRQLIVWHPEAVVALNPETGAKLWDVPFKTDMGVSIATPVFDDPLLFVSQSWGGPLMMELAGGRPGANVLWRLPAGGNANDDLVNCLMSTPILRDGHLYAISLYGELRCLEARTGRRVWQTYAPTGNDRWWNAFLIPNGERVFLANEQGELIIARLSPKGYDEISRAKLIEPTARLRDRDLVWSHPAFANRSVYARNDKEIRCVSLAADVAAPRR